MKTSGAQLPMVQIISSKYQSNWPSGLGGVTPDALISTENKMTERVQFPNSSLQGYNDTSNGLSGPKSKFLMISHPKRMRNI